MKHKPQLGGIAQALSAQGRNGDDTLVHVSKKELAGLESLAKTAFGKELPRNPRTGLKEASLFQDWFGQDVGTALGIIAPIALGFIPGIGIPAAMAAGAAMGAANQGLGKGGTTESALLGGVMGGMGAYGGTGIAEGLAGAATAAPEVALEASASTAPAALPGSAEAFGTAGGATIGGTGADVAASTATTPLQQVAQGATQNSAILGNLNATNMAANAPLAEGMTPAAGKLMGGEFIPNQLPQSIPMTAGEKMASGWSNITKSPEAFGTFAKDNIGNIGMAATGGMGAGMSMNPQEGTITTEPEGSTANPYTAEWYIDPATGQRRTRAVRAAAGGTMFSDYDAAEAAPDGGYSPGGGVNFAAGGDADADEGGLPAYMEAGLKYGPSRFKRENYALGGGIGSLGSFSDGGRLLKGPGDGVSDNIPATIEGKRPARLADGEFVIPARAVSELGNGSTEAGSKQLYKMLDRIAAKRKKGKGLAYQADPKKLLPA